jgi:hypothetical protein
MKPVNGKEEEVLQGAVNRKRPAVQTATPPQKKAALL